MDEEIDIIRKKLSKFCITRCNANCCKQGSIVLTTIEEIKNMEVIGELKNGYLSINVMDGCPKLKKNLCSIYELRPKICRDYPLFLRTKTLFIAELCPGIEFIKSDLTKLKEIKLFYQ